MMTHSYILTYHDVCGMMYGWENMNRADRRAIKFGHRNFRRKDSYSNKIAVKTNKGQTVITTERNNRIQVIDTVKNNGVTEE